MKIIAVLAMILLLKTTIFGHLFHTFVTKLLMIFHSVTIMNNFLMERERKLT